jgi:hypothetical protein
VRDLEDHGERADQEGDDVEVLQPQLAEGVRDRDRGQQHCPADVGGDHQRPLARVAVDQGAGEQREDQARDECRRGQIAHLGGAGAGAEHGQQRQREQRDLVAEQRDDIPGPVPAERGLPQQGRQPPPTARCPHGLGHRPGSVVACVVVGTTS